MKLKRIVREAVESIKADGRSVQPAAHQKLLQMHKVISNAIETLGSRVDGTKYLQSTWKMLSQVYASGSNTMAERNKLADRLREYRKIHRLSQDELAAKIGVGRRQLIRWEQGETTPHNLFIKKMESEKII